MAGCIHWQLARVERRIRLCLPCGNYENHVAGFWGDYLAYQTTNSSIGTTRFGDYVSIRQNTSDTTKFDAFGYGLNKSSPPGATVVDVHYIIFSR
jgi:hypothetical protein